MTNFVILLFKSHFIHKASCGGKGLLQITRDPSHFFGSEVISETENKRPNILIKHASIALITQETPRVLEAVNCG